MSAALNWRHLYIEEMIWHYLHMHTHDFFGYYDQSVFLIVVMWMLFQPPRFQEAERVGLKKWR